MSGTRSDDDLDPRLLTGAYALDAVSATEAESFEKATDSSATLRDETDGLVETATLLGLAATPVTPSTRLKADLMAKLSSTPQLPLSGAGSARHAATDAPESLDQAPDAAHSPAASVAEVIPAEVPATVSPAEAAPALAGPVESRARARWFSRPVGFVAGVAAAAALFVGGGFVGSALTDQPGAPVVTDASASGLAEIAAADDVARQTVAVDGGGTATLVWSNELGRSAVLVDGLPTLPDGKVYEAWYIDADGAAPAGTFAAAAEGTSWHVLDGALTPGDTIGVTVEPAGGSPAPTTTPIIVGETA
ncbi:anti-sigma factor [Herbiconiux daphne]|uniref:Regulator of SigK n=1 Tax=Herbiconiux daphne TaxID=2970914 RepID=A0ABT2GZF2_9MICO|nr:anti-sigma factor [Herbiconiux daphne]MCS5732687.1 anti-sigma factor [Herbiconiux daphne]